MGVDLDIKHVEEQMYYAIKAIILSVALSWASAQESVTANDLIGLYATSSEIGGYTGTKMFLSVDANQRLSYEMTFYSDVKSSNEIEQSVINGEALLHAEALIIARPFGFYLNQKPVLMASINVYHPVKIRDHFVLMREDAYKSWITNKTVYDYGILVQVRKTLGDEFFPEVTVQPFKMADIFGSENWKDPFVNGPYKVKP